VAWVFKRCGLEAPGLERTSLKPDASNFNVRTVRFVNAFDRHGGAAGFEPNDISNCEHVIFPFLASSRACFVKRAIAPRVSMASAEKAP
jgi:hypothetical protein